MDGVETAAGGNTFQAGISHRNDGFLFHIAYHLHLLAQLEVLIVDEGEEQGGSLVNGGGHPDVEHLARFGHVAQEKMVLFVRGDGSRRNGLSQFDGSSVGGYNLVVVTRGRSVTDIHDEVAVQDTHGNIGLGAEGGQSQSGSRIQVEQLFGAGDVDTIVYLLGDVLFHPVFGLGNAVIGRHGEGEALIVVVGLSGVRRYAGVGRQGDIGLCYGQVVGRNQRNRLAGLVNDAVQGRALEREADELTLVGFHPFSGDDDVPGVAGGVCITETVLFHQVQDVEGRLNLAVGLQGSAYPHLGHVWCGNVIGSLREIPGNGNDVAVRLGI